MLVSTVTAITPVRRRLRRALHRRAQHLAAAHGVHREQLGAEPRRRGGGAAHGVRDVVELEIEEHAAPALAQRAHRFGTGGGEQLEADLGDLGPRAEALVERQRLLQRAHVVCDRDFGHAWLAADAGSAPARQPRHSAMLRTPRAVSSARISSSTSSGARGA
jgi:hypothetical protein